MFSVLTLCFVLISVQAHQNPTQNDADLQSELMPQELNPEFVPALEPLKMVFPLSRERRSPSPYPLAPPFTSQLKHYSRMASCIVLVLSALIEIVLFLLELYNV